MIRRPPRSTQSRSSAASDVYKRQNVARFTGLSREFVLQANLRVSFDRHWKELLRDQRLTVGRLDTRYLGIDNDAAGERPEYSPEIADWDGPFGAAINKYLRSELKYNPEMQYYICLLYTSDAADDLLCVD